MKRSLLISLFRWFLVLILITGSLLGMVHFLSFETITGLLNNLASDGDFSSLTRESYQTLSKLSGLIGLILVIPGGIILIKWADTRKRIEEAFIQLPGFNQAFRNDTRAYLNALSFGGRSKTDRLIVLVLVLVAILTRLASLNIPLIHDEAYMFNAFASGSLWQTVSDYHLPNNHVLLSIIINIITHLFGNQLWLIRLPTLIAGVLMVPVGYSLGKRLYGREAGILSAALVAVFPVLVTYSVLARGYAFINLITLLILLLGDQVRENKNRFAWLVLIVLSALGFFTIPIMIFPYGALYAWLFLSGLLGDFSGYRSKPDFFKYWLVSGFTSAFLTVILYMPILINNFGRFFNNEFIAPLDWDVFPTILWVRLRNTWIEWTAFIPGWIVVLGVIGLFAGLILHKRISKQKVPPQMAFLVWIVVLLLYRRPDMLPRLWLFLAAPLLIWSAGGVVETLKLLSTKKFPFAQIFVGVAVASILLIGLFTLPTIPDRWEQKSSIESAALYLKDHLRDGDLVTANTAYFPQLRYYFEVYGVPQNYLRRSGPFQRAFMVIGERGKETLESVVPESIRSHSAINLDTVKIVLQFDDLTIYEGYPIP